MLNFRSALLSPTLLTFAAITLAMGHSAAAQAQSAFSFTTGDLVVAVEGDGSSTGAYSDGQAAPLTLYQYAFANTSSSATLTGALMLPQTSLAGGNYAVSGEYGSSSEATLQLSGDGQYLTIAGYAVNANSYNSAFDSGTGGTALAQSTNGTGAMTDVARVIALIGADGSVNSTTALTNVYNGNNPRSVYTTNGTSFYISGQGNKDDTGGVFYVPTVGATTAVAITGNDTHSSSLPNGYYQDTRDVQIVNGQLTVSVDSTEGSKSTNIDRIGTLGAPGSPPITAQNAQPTALPGINGAIALANGNGNAINNSAGSVYLSPENFFYANASTLYVTDSGDPKNGSSSGNAGAQNNGDGGLQKWSLVGGVWKLDYTLSAGLNLVLNGNDGATAKDGVSGLYGLTGKVVNGTVELFATSYVLGDTDQTYLYGISDTLADTNATQAAGEGFATLATAPADAEFKGVSFAPSPVPLPAAAWLLLSGLGGLSFLGRRRTA